MAPNPTLMIQDRFVGALPSRETVPLAGVTLVSPEQPLDDADAFARSLVQMVERMGQPRRLTVTIPDVWTHTRVLMFDRIPLSLARREEAIHWKMRSFLPQRPELYDIRYQISGTNILVAALAHTARKQLTQVLDRVFPGCYRLVPESVQAVENLASSRNGSYQMLLIVRDAYLTGVVIRGDRPVTVRSRRRSDRVPLSEEVGLLMDLTEEITGHRPDKVFHIGTDEETVGEPLDVEWLS